MTTVQSTDVSAKWVLAAKIFLTMFSLTVPLVISLNIWIVTETFKSKEKMAVMEQKTQGFMALGPRYTKTDAHLDMMKHSKENLGEVKDMLVPIKDSLNELTKKVDRIAGSR